MATVKLGTRPKSFPRIVKVKDIDGTDLTAPITFKYRTRKEYGEWIDTLPPQPTTKDGAGEDGAFSAEKYLEKMSEWNATKIMQSVDGWGLDLEFNADSVKQLCDEMPACADAIIEDYRAAIVEGRLGN